MINTIFLSDIELEMLLEFLHDLDCRYGSDGCNDFDWNLSKYSDGDKNKFILEYDQYLKRELDDDASIQIRDNKFYDMNFSVLSFLKKKLTSDI